VRRGAQPEDAFGAPRPETKCQYQGRHADTGASTGSFPGPSANRPRTPTCCPARRPPRRRGGPVRGPVQYPDPTREGRPSRRRILTIQPGRPSCHRHFVACGNRTIDSVATARERIIASEPPGGIGRAPFPQCNHPLWISPPSRSLPDRPDPSLGRTDRRIKKTPLVRGFARRGHHSPPPTGPSHRQVSGHQTKRTPIPAKTRMVGPSRAH
jgi:hypothetical protein